MKKLLRKFLREIIINIPRTKFSLHFFKFIILITKSKSLTKFLDPNYANDNIKYQHLLSQELNTIKICDGIKLKINLNDHIGFKIFLYKTFDNTIISKI
jgi:hypothetical protein